MTNEVTADVPSLITLQPRVIDEGNLVIVPKEEFSISTDLTGTDTEAAEVPTLEKTTETAKGQVLDLAGPGAATNRERLTSEGLKLSVGQTSKIILS